MDIGLAPNQNSINVEDELNIVEITIRKNT